MDTATVVVLAIIAIALVVGVWLVTSRRKTELLKDRYGAEYDRCTVGSLMTSRGYPVADFEQRAADISVDHPLVVEHYRAAHDIALRQERRAASTEDLRQALVQYRALFSELLEDRVPVEAHR